MVFSQKRKASKIIELLMQVIVFKVIFFGVRCIDGSSNFTLINLVKSFVPNNYYVIFYVALFFISLYINVVISVLTKKDVCIMLIILMVLLSIYPTIVDSINDFTSEEIIDLSTISREGSGNGYTIVQFCLMYVIGAAIGRYKDDVRIFKNKYLIIAWMIDVLVIFITSYCLHDKFISTALSYCNPFVILEAVIIFLIFKNMNINDSRIINRLAKGSFTVYLVHTPFLSYLHYDRVAKLNPLYMTIIILFTITIIYILGWLIYEVYNFINSKTIKKIIDKLNIPDLEIKSYNS